MSFLSRLLSSRGASPSQRVQADAMSKAAVQVVELLKHAYGEQHGQVQLESAERSHFLFRPLKSQQKQGDGAPEHIMVSPQGQNLYFETDNLQFADTIRGRLNALHIAEHVRTTTKDSTYGNYAIFLLENVRPADVETHYRQTFPHAAKVQKEAGQGEERTR